MCVLSRLRKFRDAAIYDAEVRAVRERLNAALAAASTGDRAHHRLVPVQPVAELLDHEEYVAWREDHLSRLPDVHIPEPKPNHRALVLFPLRPAMTEAWLRGEHTKLMTAPVVVFPPGPDNADTALESAIGGWLDMQAETYSPCPPLLRRDAASAFEVADLGRVWPGRVSWLARTALAERPGRRRPMSRHRAPQRPKRRP